MLSKSKINHLISHIFLLILLASAITRSSFILPSIISFMAFGLAASNLVFVDFKFINAKILIFSLILIAVYKFFNIPWPAIVFSLLIFISGIFILKNRFILPKKFTKISLTLLLLGFLIISFLESKDIRNHILNEPQAEKFVSDNMLYLKTFYQVKRGKNFHQSFAQSYQDDARSTSLPPDLWGFRLPTTFFLWSTITGKTAANIYLFFLLNSCLILILAFLIAQKLIKEKYSLIAPYLLMPYLLFASTTFEFLQIEWWGLLPMFIFIWAVLFNKNLLSLIASFWAIITRELFLIPLGFAGLASLIFKKLKLTVSLIISFLLFSISVFLHALQVFKIIPFSRQMIVGGRTHHGFGFEMSRQALAFGSWRYLFAPFKLFSIYLLIIIFGGLYLFVKFPRKRFQLAFLISLFLLTLVSFLRIGHCCWSDYWGVIMAPFLILTTSIIVGLFLNIKNL